MRGVSLPETQTFTLACHPATPTQIVRRLAVHVALGAAGRLDLHYELEAQMDRLRIPEPRKSTRGDELWKHTCFEAFLCAGDGDAYRELNFAPSTQWAVYSFGGYRKGMAQPVTPAPEIQVQRDEQRLTLRATVNPGVAAVRRIALAAVIEDGSGRLSYWALRHPSGKPDFHHPESFVTPS